MKLKRLGRLAIYAVFNTGVYAAAFAGGHGGVEWAGNMLRFYAWLSFFLGGLLYLGWHAVRKVEDEEAADVWDSLVTYSWTVPKTLDFALDAGAAFVMASAGWFATAAAFILSAFFVLWTRMSLEEYGDG